MDSSTELRLSPMRGAMTIGAATAGVMLVVSALNLPVLGWFVFVVGIYFGMRTYRRVLGDIIVYTKALNVGFKTAFFASLILAFFTYVTTTIDSSLIDSTLEAMEQQLKTYSISPVLVEAAIQQWREMLSPVVIAAITIFTYSAMGGLLSIVLACFVRNAKSGEFVEY